MSEPIEPPTMPEIHAIVLRRRRTRYRATQGALGLAVAATIGYGLSRSGSQDLVVAPAAGGPPSASVPGPDPVPPSTGSPTSDGGPVITPPGAVERHPAPSFVDPVPGADILAPEAPRWLEAAADRYAADQAGDPAGFAAALTLADDWGLDVAETKAVLGVAFGLGQDLDATSDDSLVSDFQARGGSYREAAAIADDWGVDPLVVKLLAALDIAEVPITLG